MKHDTQYIRVRFQKTGDALDLQARMITHDPLGFLEEDEWWEVYFEDAAWRSAEQMFRGQCERDGLSVQYEIERFAEENWNQKWEEGIQPIQVTDRIVIAPSWSEVSPPDGGMVLVIDPKMSFGTGYHATTRLMLRLLETHVHPGDHVLDMGTGTGVLAIAAILLGAERAVGVDTDEWSYDNAMENAQRNDVQDRVSFAMGSIDEAAGRYDLILSNITKIDNLQLLPRLEAMLRPGGRIILSGFYQTDLRDMHLALEQLRLRADEEITEDEWAAVAAGKEAP